jgi:hypothetical protein
MPIIVVNLLIAMMSETYAVVKEEVQHTLLRPHLPSLCSPIDFHFNCCFTLTLSFTHSHSQSDLIWRLYASQVVHMREWIGEGRAMYGGCMGC